MPLDVAPAVWFSTPPFEKTREQVMEVMVTCLRESGFEPEVRDAARGEIVSKWVVRLRPMWREGRQERVEMYLEQAAGGRFVVRTRTVREVNDNSRNPMVFSEADWIDGGGNDGISERITLMIKMRISGLRMDD